MRQCQRKGICYIIYFSHRGFSKMIFEAYWPYGQGVIRLRLWVYLKCLLTLVIVYYGISSYFSHWFEGVLPSIPELLWFFPQGFSKILLTFFLKSFWGVIYYIASPDFSYRIFKELFDWLQDHKKIKLITRPQEGQIDQGGVLWKNWELVINSVIK